MTTTKNYKDIYFHAEDDTRLYARDYRPADNLESDDPDNDKIVTVLCMHGLTRNCRDFEPMLAKLRPDTRIRYIVPDQRGRGSSEYCAPGKYTPETYVQDMWTLMEHLKIEHFLIIGTSMGGIISLLMCSQIPSRIRGICLNDVGPVIDLIGLKQVFDYLGKNMQANSWEEAVKNTRRVQAMNFPEFNDEDWLKFAERLYQQDSNNSLSLAYDSGISEPLKATLETGVSNELWPLFNSTLEANVLILRGEFSQLLSKATLRKMQAMHPQAKAIEVKNRGHAPLLNEPEAISAIESWITESCS